MKTNCAFAFVALLLTTSKAYAEVVQWKTCPTDANAPANCTIHEIRVNPCKEAAEAKPCKLKRGNDADISFDYTPNFDATSLESRAYWTTQFIDLPFLGLESDACKSTSCPVTAGQKQTYSVQLPIAQTYPARTFDVKWKLSNDRAQVCCFIFQIKLSK